MGIIKRWFARMSREVWEEARNSSTGKLEPAIAAPIGHRGDNPPKQFAVHTALNGTYITFTTHRYNPNGPDDYVSEVYLVRDDESVVDAVAAVLVLMDARSER